MADKIVLTIDGREVEAEAGAPLVEVIKKAGLFIPNLCYIDGLPPYAGCRTCAVEVDGMRGTQTSCTLKAQAGMVVHTDTPAVVQARKAAQSMIQANHPDRCLTCHRRIKCGWGDICLRDDIVTYRCVTCAKNKRCELLATSEGLQMQLQERFYFEERSWYNTQQPPTDRANPFMEYDPHICILCTRCLRACDEVRFTTAIGLANRGPRTFITFGQGGPIQDSDCDFNGACVDVCPTGALMEHPNKWAGLPQRWVESACADCSSGCRVHVGLRNGQIVQIKPLACSGIMHDQICARGRYGYDILGTVPRLESPQVRRGEALSTVSWDEALESAVAGLADVVSKSGPGAVACLASSRVTNEESYVFQKLARSALGTGNIDNMSMLYYRPAVEAMSAAFGSPVSPGSVGDLSSASLIVVVGGDISASHPIVSLRIKQAAGEKGRRVPLMVIGPKTNELKRFANQWLTCRPGGEPALLNALAAQLLARSSSEGASSLPGYTELKEQLQGLDIQAAAQAAGVSPEEVGQAAERLAQALRAEDGKSVYFVLGPQPAPAETMRATVTSLLNLALMANGARQRGPGAIILPPDANSQGALDMGVAPDLLPGGKPAQTKGLDVASIIEAINEGQIKALVLHGDDALLALSPVQLDGALRRLESLVIVGSLATDITRLAHVALPGQAAYEKDGTTTSGGREVQRLRSALPAPGDAKPDWWILSELGQRLAQRLGKQSDAFAYDSASAIADEIAREAPQYAGATHAALDECGSVQWQPEVKPRFQPMPSSPVPQADRDYPYFLITGRPLFTSFEAVVTHRSEADLLHREEHLDISMADAATVGVATGDQVVVESSTGSMTIPVRVTDSIRDGAVYVSQYWRGGVVNNLLPIHGETAQEVWWKVRLSKAR